MRLTLTFLLLSALAWAATVGCPVHDWAYCNSTGQTKVMNNQTWELYKCTCGDSYWVRAD
jgi:hypothetical protein